MKHKPRRRDPRATVDDALLDLQPKRAGAPTPWWRRFWHWLLALKVE